MSVLDQLRELVGLKSSEEAEAAEDVVDSVPPTLRSNRPEELSMEDIAKNVPLLEEQNPVDLLAPQKIFALQMRVERLQEELRATLGEKKTLEEVAEARWARASELLEFAREGRRLVRDFRVTFDRERCDETTSREDVDRDCKKLEEWADRVL